ncbi:MAG: hypothetical protein ACJ8CR_07555 [Roseiflexaceae bacterium]
MPDNLLALVQGLFYIVTGVWLLLSIRCFEWVTGPKTDRWLVKTAGVLITAIGAALTMAGLRRSVTGELRLLAISSALGLTGIDVIYVARGRIAKIYLLDAVVELALVVAWLRDRAELPTDSGDWQVELEP